MMYAIRLQTGFGDRWLYGLDRLGCKYGKHVEVARKFASYESAVRLMWTFPTTFQYEVVEV